MLEARGGAWTNDHGVHDRALENLRASLGDDLFERERAAGRPMDADRAITAALDLAEQIVRSASTSDDRGTDTS